MADSLNVLISGVHAGALRQLPNGALSFSYDANYAGVPLSLSMPLSNKTYADKIVRPYLFGLLPDSIEVRRNLGREYGVSGNNPFKLLSIVGLDCPGAVQFCTDNLLDGLSKNRESEGDLILASDADIARRLRTGRTNLVASWETVNEHWSLGGQQSKFALRRKDNHWYSCKGLEATTHIFKPGIPSLMLEALNEYICLNTASACGVPAVECEYAVFEDEPAIVISRYDRVQGDDGNITRIHQEDFCQALSVLPENKYTNDGGPSASAVINLCKKTGDFAARNIQAFIDMLFINYLLGAPDGHAKNYSLLLNINSAFLAPLYDVASVLPYTDREASIKLAMSLAGENRLGSISRNRLSRFAEINELQEYEIDGKLLVNRLMFLSEALPVKLQSVLEANSSIAGIDELGERLLPKVQNLCALSASRLG